MVWFCLNRDLWVWKVLGFAQIGVWGAGAWFCSNRELGVRLGVFLQMRILGSDSLVLHKVLRVQQLVLLNWKFEL